MLTQAQRDQRHTVRIKRHRQRVKAKKAAKLDDPNALTQPLTARSLNKETKAAVKLRYGGQEAALTGQIRASDQQQRNIGGWYGDWLRANANAAVQTAQGYQQAAAQIGATADRSTQIDAQNRAAQVAAMRADAAQRGATIGNQDQLGVQAEASRRVGLDEAQAATVRTGANQNAYLADRGRIGAGSAVSAHQQESNRKRNLQGQKVALKGEKGDYAVQYRSNARVTERNARSTEAALGIKAAAVKVSAKNATTARLNAQNTKAYHDSVIANQQRGMNHDDAVFAAQKQHHTGPFAPANKDTPAGRLARKRDRAQQANHTGPYASAKGPNNHTPSQKHAAKVEIRKWEAKVRVVRKSHPHWTEQQTLDALNGASTSPSDPLIGRAAVQRVYRGGVGPKTRRKLRHNYGIHVPGPSRSARNRNAAQRAAQGTF